MTPVRLVALGALGALVIMGAILCLDQAAKADVTPIIIPVAPTVSTMNIGSTVEPGPDDGGYLPIPTTLKTTSFVPPVTAVPFGGMLG